MPLGDRLLLAKAHRFELGVRHTERLEFVQYRLRAALAERKVVLIRAPFIRVALNQHMLRRMASQIVGVRVQQLQIVALDRVAVEIEASLRFASGLFGLLSSSIVEVDPVTGCEVAAFMLAMPEDSGAFVAE